ncbi:hypothetical protein [Nitratireductor soli]|uniref:hypothetical protein n=1 Tax=Nitratireductor soli TaxID=1670619 RepID=UPI00065DE9EF|nr:hypothetical protein [Nitratireductor soli]
MSEAARSSSKHHLCRRLTTGASVTYWQVGETTERRYDLPDQTMVGAMDPFFFLTREKNFIPHEYPCRTQFAAEHRGKRPSVEGSFMAKCNWLPFGSPRLDLSGFWFRPTRLATWARTVIIAQQAGACRLKLATCGGAVLYVNGREVGYLAPYSRNLEQDAVFETALEAGENEVLVYFDDLAERDARYYIQLDYLDGPSAEMALPVAGDAKAAASIEAALSGMHFEAVAYTGGEVALRLPDPLPFTVETLTSVEGDFMSREELALTSTLTAGADRLVIARAQDLPGDFRHFTVTLAANGFAASRTFGVEICHAERQGSPPAAAGARIGEALREVADFAEPDAVRALARLALGDGGDETQAMLEKSLPAIEDCHDCADFHLVPMIWCRARYADLLPAALIARIDDAMATYRYWFDEPGNDVQWYFSENHALLFHTAAYLAGHLLPETRFRRSGRLGRAQSAIGAERVRAWLDHFEQWEMAEFNSAPYFPIDFKGLTTLYALAPDAGISARAGRAITRLMEVIANSAHRGVVTAAQGRSYEHTLRASRSLELSAIARLLWGRGHYGARFHALPQLALCLRDHGLVPPTLAERATLTGDSAQEWTFAQGENRFARLYHYKTADHAMGTAAAYRWNEWGYQETLLHARIGGDPDAQLWINQPGEVIHSGFGRPSYWGGSATIPRVQQYRDLAVLVFEGKEEQPDFSHAWLPLAVFDAAHVSSHMATAACDGGRVLVKASAPLERVASGPTAGSELRLNARSGHWIVRLGDGRQHGDLDAFERRFADLALHVADDETLVIDDPDYGTVRFMASGHVAAEGRLLKPEDWTVLGNRTEMAIGPLQEAVRIKAG